MKQQPKRATGVQLAQRVGLARSTITKYSQDGILQRGRDGKFDLAESLAAIQNHEASRQTAGVDRDEGTRLRHEYLRKRIERLQIEIDRERGALMETHFVKSEVTRLFGSLKARLLALPSQLAGLTTGNPPDDEKLFYQSIHKLLTDTSHEWARNAQQTPAPAAQSQGTA